MPRFFLLLVLLSGPLTAHAQLLDAFADGDFTDAPPWTGTPDGWTVEPFGTDFALRSNGPPRADTLALVTPSSVAYGTWSFLVVLADGGLSNFNQVRLFVHSDAADLNGPVAGYAVQLGTNSRDVRLYRYAPDLAYGRTLLVQSPPEVLAPEPDTVQVTITRSVADGWRVELDGVAVLTHQEADPPSIAATHLGLWVKHSSRRGRSFWFDDITVEAGAPTDTTPPRLASLEVAGDRTLRVTFDEPVYGCDPAAYEVDATVDSPARIASCPDGTPRPTYVLEWDDPLEPSRPYTLRVSGIEDAAGNRLEEATATFRYDPGLAPPEPGDLVINEIQYTPPTSDEEYVELYNRSERTLPLSGLRLADARGAFVPVSADGPLAPGGYLVLARDSAAFATAFPGVAFTAVSGWPALNDGGDAVVIAADTAVLDSVSYASTWSDDGGALERRDPGGPSNAATNWANSTNPRGGTPGARNTRYEIDEAPPTLLSAAYRPDLPGLRLRFSEPLAPLSVAAAAFRVVAGPPVLAAEAAADSVTLTLGESLADGVYQLEIRGVRDLKGNTLDLASVAFTVFTPATPEPGDVVINEIAFAPADGEAEYVELYNRTDRSFDLRAFRLADERDVPVALVDTLHPLRPGAFVVLARSGPAFEARFPGAAYVEVPDWPSLNNGGDVVTLYHELQPNERVAIDRVPYEASWSNGDGALERRDPAGPSDHPSNWGASTAPAAGTPGAPNSLLAPDRNPPSPVFADEVADDQVEVRFDEPLEPASVRPDRFRLGGQAATNVTPRNDDTQTWRVRFAGPLGQADLQVTSLADLTGNTLTSATVAVARRPAAGELIINELLPAPLADPNDGRVDQPEFVELYNRSDRLLTTRGLLWTDAPDERGIADTLRLTPTPLGLAPGAHAVVFAQSVDLDGADVHSQSDLALAFPVDYRALGAVLLPVRAASLRLNNDRDVLRLQRADGVVLDAVAYRPAWHDPALSDVRGRSLERLTPSAASDDGRSWSTSLAPEGATPGQPNSLTLDPGARAPRPGDLLVNEVLYAPRADPDDGLPDQPEYVELVNLSPDRLDLRGLALTEPLDENGQADTLHFGRPAVLPPGAYAVLFAVTDASTEPAAALREAFPDVPAEAVLLAVRTSLALPDAPTERMVLASDGTLLATLRYDPAWHTEALAETRGRALERRDLQAPGSDPGTWTSSASPSGGTPGRLNSVALPAETAQAPGLTPEPSPFSPDGDGIDDAVALRYLLRAAPALLRVRIFDASGRLVRTLEPGQLAPASGSLVWDGRDDAGRELRLGVYVVHFEAVHTEDGVTETFVEPVVLARRLR